MALHPWPSRNGGKQGLPESLQDSGSPPMVCSSSSLYLISPLSLPRAVPLGSPRSGRSSTYRTTLCAVPGHTFFSEARSLLSNRHRFRLLDARHPRRLHNATPRPYATRGSEPLHISTKITDHRTYQSVRLLLIALPTSLHALPGTLTP